MLTKRLPLSINSDKRYALEKAYAPRPLSPILEDGQPHGLMTSHKEDNLRKKLSFNNLLLLIDTDKYNSKDFIGAFHQFDPSERTASPVSQMPSPHSPFHPPTPAYLSLHDIQTAMTAYPPADPSPPSDTDTSFPSFPSLPNPSFSFSKSPSKIFHSFKGFIKR